MEALKPDLTRFPGLNDTIDIFIPTFMPVPVLYLTVFAEFEIPGSSKLEKRMFSATTNFYTSSLAILVRKNIDSNTMYTQASF